MIDACLLLSALVSIGLTGTAFAGWALGRPGSSSASRAEFWGLSLLLGVGGIAWLQFVGSVAGLPLGRRASIGLGLVGSLSGVVLLAASRRQRPNTVLPTPWSRFASAGVVAIWIGLLIQTVLTPQRLWDERAIFGIKSAVLFEEGTIHAPVLQHPQFVQGHPRYPLLLPLAETYVYGWIGRVDDRWGKLIAPLMALGLWLAFAGVLERHVGSDRAWLGALLLATVPALTTWEYGYLCVQADAIVASLHGLSVLYLWDVWRTWNQARSLPVRAVCIAGVAAGLCLFTKDEGIALGLVDGVACGCVAGVMWGAQPSSVGGRGWLRVIGAGALPFLVIAVPWFLWRRALPVTTEMTYFSRLSGDNFAAGLATLTWSGPHLVQRTFREATVYGLMWWGVVGAACLAPRRLFRPAQLFLALDLVGALLALLIAGMLAPVAVEDHIGGSSHRFLLQLIPTAVLFLLGQMSPSSVEAAGPDPTGNA